MEIDLNLDNYNLAELLNLFKLKNNINIDDLKTTKKIVMKLHPDKSGLDKEYFKCAYYHEINRYKNKYNKEYLSWFSKTRKRFGLGSKTMNNLINIVKQSSSKNSGFPFLTVVKTMSPGPAEGYRFNLPFILETAIM